MSLLDTISAIFKPRAAKPTTSDVATAPNKPDIGSLYSAERGRERIVSFSRDMYASDSRIEGIINSVARDSVRGGFTVNTTDTRAAESALRLTERLKLGSRLDDWVRLTFRDGDSMIEIGITAEREIVSASRKPTLAMHRNSDDHDQFTDPTRAFWYSSDSWAVEPPPNAIWFAEWQIIHARFKHDEGSRYGRPMFASATNAFKRVKEGETDIAVRRKTRAGMKYLHVVEGADDNALRDYKENNKAALDNPFAAIADFFTNKPGSITTVQGDQTIGAIDDILHHIDTLGVASPIPLELIGYGRDLNRDVLDAKKEQYDEALPSITQWVEDEFVKPLVERQWLLDGIVPEGVKYEIEWQNKAWVSAKDLLDVANAATALRTAFPTIPEETLISILQRFLPGIDVHKVMDAVQNDPASKTNPTPSASQMTTESRLRQIQFAQLMREFREALGRSN